MADTPIKPENQSKKTTNLGDYDSQTRIRMVIWFILILFILGLGLIWVFLGRNAALFGFLCLLGAGVPIGLIALSLLGLDAVVKKSK